MKPFSAIRHLYLGFALTILVLIPQIASAQLNGENLKGDLGLASGSQAPPGAYAGFLYYRYNTDRINTKTGAKFNPSGSTTIAAGAPFFNMVTKKKFLGANYGFFVAVPILNTALETPRLDSKPTAHVGDIYVQPVNLGWHLKKADVTAAYGFYAPTGRYTAGANNNTGYGMWSHELSLGTTVYLDKKKAWNAATTGALEFHTTKKNSNGAKVGTLFTLEGGLGRKFMDGGLNVGMVYYAQWKITDDRFGSLLPSVLVTGRHRVAAIGPEATLALASKKKGKLYGFLTARYYHEAYARTTTKGNSFLIQLVFPLKPISLGPPPPGK